MRRARPGIAGALIGLGLVRQLEGDYAGAEPVLREGLALFESVGDEYGEGHALNRLGLLAMSTGELAARSTVWSRVFPLATLGDQQMIANDLHNLGEAHHLSGSLDEAERHYREALARFEDLGIFRPGLALCHLGLLAIDRGNLTQARDLLRQSLRLRWGAGLRASTADTLEAPAETTWRLGDRNLATTMLQRGRPDPRRDGPGPATGLRSAVSAMVEAVGFAPEAVVKRWTSTPRSPRPSASGTSIRGDAAVPRTASGRPRQEARRLERVVTPSAASPVELAAGSTVAARDAARAGALAILLRQAACFRRLGRFADLVVRLRAAELNYRIGAADVVEEALAGATCTGAAARPIGAAHGLAALRWRRAAVPAATDNSLRRVAALAEVVAMAQVRRCGGGGDFQGLFGGGPRFVAENDLLGLVRFAGLIGFLRLVGFGWLLGALDAATP